MPSIRDSCVNAHFSLVLEIRSKLDASICDLVLFAIPDRRIGELNALSSPVGSHSSKLTASNGTYDKCDQSVFTIVSQVVESIEKVIPSFVSIEAPKEGLDFREQIFVRPRTLLSRSAAVFPKGKAA